MQLRPIFPSSNQWFDSIDIFKIPRPKLSPFFLDFKENVLDNQAEIHWVANASNSIYSLDKSSQNDRYKKPADRDGKM